MIKDNIQFDIPDEYGIKITCFLLGSIPISENEVNIIYKKKNDNDDVIRYGKLISNNNEYYLTNNIDKQELEELKRQFDNQLIEFLKETLPNE